MIDQIDKGFYYRAMEKLGFRQRAYQQAFGQPGSPAYLALVDLADYCGAFRADVVGLNEAHLREMNGRRQVFFRLWQHLNLNQAEMETVFKGSLLRTAETMQLQGAR
jgi:hypothetical protein